MQQSDMRSFDIFEKHFCILTITVLRALLCHEDIWVSLYIWIYIFKYLCIFEFSMSVEVDTV